VQFDALLSTDSGIAHQNNTASIDIAVVVMEPKRNKLLELLPLVPRLLEILPGSLPRTVTHIAPDMKIQVFRQACCAADDQIGPLEAEYEIQDSKPLSDLIDLISVSGFLQFSSTHNHICGEIAGKSIVEMYPHGGKRPVFHANPNESVSSLIGNQALYFRFHNV
jgi:hypothetical protein